MAGIINKIEETLGMGGGKKEGDKQNVEQHKKAEGYGGEHKEGGGLMDKVKDKISGQGKDGSSGDNYGDKGEKKKKKEKKKKHGEDGHEKHGDSSSDSD